MNAGGTTKWKTSGYECKASTKVTSYLTKFQNLSPNYTMMLMAQALSQLLQKADLASFDGLSKDFIQDRVPIVLSQILNRTLLNSPSLDDFAAEPFPETVAYGVLTCVALRALPWPKPLLDQLDATVQAGKTYICRMESSWRQPMLL